MLISTMVISNIMPYLDYDVCFLQVTGSHLVQCHMQMECTDTSLVYLMSYVPECGAANNFPISRNNIFSDIMISLLVHIHENNPMPDHWAYLEDSRLIKLGEQLSGSVPTFENIRNFRCWVNSVAKSMKSTKF